MQVADTSVGSLVYKDVTLELSQSVAVVIMVWFSMLPSVCFQIGRLIVIVIGSVSC